MKSLHLLLATTGRTTLTTMLNSLKDQLREEDFLTIVFDAMDEGGVFDKVAAMGDEFKATLTVIMEPTNLGFWGHGIRNKHNDLPGGDFIMHVDDDDAYLPGAIDRVKEACTDPDTLYMFGIQVTSECVMDGSIIETTGTSTGTIPRELNKKGEWMPYYGGDKAFYKDIVPLAKAVVVVPCINYASRPHLRRTAKPAQVEALSVHVLLATIGRHTIFNMLNSLKDQLREEDFLTIVFDAKDEDNVFDKVTAMRDQFKATVYVIMEAENLGWHGHGVRNKYNELLGGDFFMHADDDDIYSEHAIDVVKEICTDPATLYFFGVLLQDDDVMLATKSCGTPNGVIPRAMSNTAEWLPRYGGDVDFYRSIIVKATKRKYNSNIIYVVRPQERDDPEGFVHSACDD